MAQSRKVSDAKKQALITNLVNARGSILTAVRALPEARLDEIFLGYWSVKDLLAHLMGWDVTNLQAVREVLAGTYPTFFQYYDKDWQNYNRQLVAQYRQESGAAMLAAVEETHRQFIRFLQTLDADTLLDAKATNPKGRTVTLRNLLTAEAVDERVHAGQVAAFGKRSS